MTSMFQKQGQFVTGLLDNKSKSQGLQHLLNVNLQCSIITIHQKLEDTSECKINPAGEHIDLFMNICTRHCHRIKVAV